MKYVCPYSPNFGICSLSVIRKPMKSDFRAASAAAFTWLTRPATRKSLSSFCNVFNFALNETFSSRHAFHSNVSRIIFIFTFVLMFTAFPSTSYFHYFLFLEVTSSSKIPVYLSYSLVILQWHCSGSLRYFNAGDSAKKEVPFHRQTPFHSTSHAIWILSEFRSNEDARAEKKIRPERRKIKNIRTKHMKTSS